MQARREPERTPERTEEYQARVEPLDRVRDRDQDRDRYRDTEGYIGYARAYGGRDLIHWGPVWAGVIASFATIILLGALGLAVGLAAFNPSSPTSQIGTAASVWGAVTLAIAFFIGGWLAGRTSSYRTNFSGFLDGSMVWALGLTLLLLASGLGISGTLGAAASIVQGVNPSAINVPVAPGEIARMTQSAAIWSFVGLLVAWIITVVGAITGARSAMHQDPGVE